MKKRPVASTSMLPAVLLNAPVLVSNIASTAAAIAAIASIASTVDQYRRGYQMGHKIVSTVNNYAQPAMQVLGLSTAAAASTTTADVSTALPASVMSGALLWNGWNVFSSLLQKSHGKLIENKIHMTNALQLNSALATPLLWNRIPYLNYPSMNKGTHWTSGMPAETKMMVGAFLMALASYLHSNGSDIMKKNTQAMDTDLKYPKEAGEREWLERVCYNLYLNNDYYTANNASGVAYLSSPANWHPVRIVANIMIGLFQQMGLLHSDADDPVHMFVKSAKVVGYWEVLAQLIGLYGWAPVYMATHWLAEGILLL